MEQLDEQVVHHQPPTTWLAHRTNPLPRANNFFQVFLLLIKLDPLFRFLHSIKLDTLFRFLHFIKLGILLRFHLSTLTLLEDFELVSLFLLVLETPGTAMDDLPDFPEAEATSDDLVWWDRR